MHKQDGLGRILDGRAKNLARMDQASVEGADADPMHAGDSILRVQGYDVKFLVGCVTRKPFEMQPAEGESVFGAGDALGPTTLFLKGAGNATAQFNTSHDLTKSSLANGGRDLFQFAAACVNKPMELIRVARRSFPRPEARIPPCVRYESRSPTIPGSAKLPPLALTRLARPILHGRQGQLGAMHLGFEPGFRGKTLRIASPAVDPVDSDQMSVSLKLMHQQRHEPMVLVREAFLELIQRELLANQTGIQSCPKTVYALLAGAVFHGLSLALIESATFPEDMMLGVRSRQTAETMPFER